MAAAPLSEVQEGRVAFRLPDGENSAETWYKIVGNLDSPSPPLIALHGGPGAGHGYLSSLTDLHEKYQIPIVFYDQVGCGNSTHFRDKMGDTSFWIFDLFYTELDNLIDHLQLRQRGFFLLGQSWGGVLAGAYASRTPSPVGLKKLVIASGPASILLYVKGCQGLLAQLPEDVRKTLEDCDRRGDHESPEFEAAASVFYSRHVCRLDPYPEAVTSAFANLKDDPTSYLTIQGPSEFVIIGSIKDWEGWQDAHRIQVDTLLLNGRHDEVTNLSMEPWFTHIPRVRWVTLENSSHMGHYEDRERYMEVAGEFLSSGMV